MSFLEDMKTMQRKNQGNQHRSRGRIHEYRLNLRTRTIGLDPELVPLGPNRMHYPQSRSRALCPTKPFSLRMERYWPEIDAYIRKVVDTDRRAEQRLARAFGSVGNKSAKETLDGGLIAVTDGIHTKSLCSGKMKLVEKSDYVAHTQDARSIIGTENCQGPIRKRDHRSTLRTWFKYSHYEPWKIEGICVRYPNNEGSSDGFYLTPKGAEYTLECLYNHATTNYVRQVAERRHQRDERIRSIFSGEKYRFKRQHRRNLERLAKAGKMNLTKPSGRSYSAL